MNDLEHFLWQLVLKAQSANTPDLTKIMALMDRAANASKWAEDRRQYHQQITATILPFTTAA
jgi:hypothetical protein